MTTLRQTCCGILGHDVTLQLEEGAMRLICVSCGYRSSGWQLPAGDKKCCSRQTRTNERRRSVV